MTNPVELPRPSAWPQEITEQEFRQFAPRSVELVDGNLFATEEERLNLLALLLTNCGLEAAAMMSDSFDWHEAADRAGLNL